MPLFLFLLLTTVYTMAQTPYRAVDKQVTVLGALEKFNVATIADTLTRTFSEKSDKARAIYYWIANNIALDPKAVRANDTKKVDPVLVIESRKATALGFANLFQEMCSMANIRCLVVDGYAKNFAGDINNKADEINHSWNVVQLGQSPEQWYYVDAAKGSGFIDKKFTTFTRRFTSEYFFADKYVFNLDHYPDNSAWLLGGDKRSLSSFYALPGIGYNAYAYGLKKIEPQLGFIKAKNTTAVNFSFNYSAETPIQSIELVIGEGNRQLKPEPMNFTDNSGSVRFVYTFKKADSYPVRVLVNGSDFVQYLAEIEE